MRPLFDSNAVQIVVQIGIGGVWVFHGLYSKILGGIPRHRAIVARILGEKIVGPTTKSIGILEVLLGCWVFSGIARPACATVQTIAILAMNALEILLARDLLISPLGMALMNCGFLALIWQWALASSKL